MSSQGFVFLLLTWIIWKKKFCRRTSLETTCFWCFFCCNLKKIRCTGGVFVRLWGFCTIHCFFCQVGYMKRVLSLFVAWNIQPFQAEEDEGEEEGEGEAGDMKDRIISRKRSMGMSQLWIYDVYEFRNMWGFTVFGYIVLIKTYQQLGFLCKRWRLNTCTGFRLVVLLKWDVLTKEIGVPPQKKRCAKTDPTLLREKIVKTGTWRHSYLKVWHKWIVETWREPNMISRLERQLRLRRWAFLLSI